MNILSAAGVLYDIVGAYLIARAIVFARPKILAEQSATVLNANPALFATLDEQQHDARFGVGILVGGFLLQFLAALDCSVSVTYWPLFAAALAVALGGYVAVGLRLKSTRDARLNTLLIGVSKIQDLL